MHNKLGYRFGKLTIFYTSIKYDDYKSDRCIIIFIKNDSLQIRLGSFYFFTCLFSEICQKSQSRNVRGALLTPLDAFMCFTSKKHERYVNLKALNNFGL